MPTQKYSDERDVALASGTGPILIETSGEFIKISGQSIYVASGTGPLLVSTSGQVIKISGETVTIAGGVNISGQPVKVSGETVTIAGGVNVSGAPVKVSGEMVEAHIMSGLVSSILSGEFSITPPTAVRARPVIGVFDTSGGTILLSGDCKAAMLKSLAGDIWVGGITSPDLPYSGNGILLMSGDVISLDIQNFNLIRLCGNVSGNLVSYGGIT